MLAPRLRAMVRAMFESVCTVARRQLRDAGPNLPGRRLVLVLPAHGGGPATARAVVRLHGERPPPAAAPRAPLATPRRGCSGHSCSWGLRDMAAVPPPTHF